MALGDWVTFGAQSERRSGRKRPGLPKLSCRQCGAEVRPGSRLCTSCWKPVDSDTRDSHPTREAQARRSRSRVRRPGSHDAVQSKMSSGASTGADSIFHDLYCRFQALPFVAKAMYIGLSMLVLLTVLSPLTFLASVVVLVISTTIVIVRAFNRRPLQRWVVIALVSILATLAGGSISNAYYGVLFSGGGVQLSEEEQRYIDQVGRLQEAMNQRLDYDAQVLEKYPSIPLLERERVYDLYFSDEDLKRTAEEKVMVPLGCEDHYAIWLEGMDKATTALYTDIMVLDTMLGAAKEPWHRTSADEIRRDTEASFEEAGQVLNQVRRKGCQR